MIMEGIREVKKGLADIRDSAIYINENNTSVIEFDILRFLIDMKHGADNIMDGLRCLNFIPNSKMQLETGNGISHIQNGINHILNSLNQISNETPNEKFLKISQDIEDIEKGIFEIVSILK